MPKVTVVLYNVQEHLKFSYIKLVIEALKLAGLEESDSDIDFKVNIVDDAVKIIGTAESKEVIDKVRQAFHDLALVIDFP